jgi:hypothetical protein
VNQDSLFLDDREQGTDAPDDERGGTRELVYGEVL